MAGKNTGSSSVTMAVARIVIGIMFLFFAQYKLMGREFAHGGYEKYVTGYVQESAVSVSALMTCVDTNTSSMMPSKN